MKKDEYFEVKWSDAKDKIENFSKRVWVTLSVAVTIMASLMGALMFLHTFSTPFLLNVSISLILCFLGLFLSIFFAQIQYNFGVNIVGNGNIADFTEKKICEEGYKEIDEHLTQMEVERPTPKPPSKLKTGMLAIKLFSFFFWVFALYILYIVAAVVFHFAWPTIVIW